MHGIQQFLLQILFLITFDVAFHDLCEPFLMFARACLFILERSKLVPGWLAIFSTDLLSNIVSELMASLQNMDSELIHPIFHTPFRSTRFATSSTFCHKISFNSIVSHRFVLEILQIFIICFFQRMSISVSAAKNRSLTFLNLSGNENKFQKIINISKLSDKCYFVPTSGVSK